MVNKSGSKKLSYILSFLLFSIVFTIVYACLFMVTAPLLITMGEERNVFEKAYVFFLVYPFNGSGSLWLILPNGVIWAFVFYVLGIAIFSLLRKRRN